MRNLLLGKVEAVLNCILTADHPVPLKELSGTLDLPLSVVSRIASDLCEMGLIEKADYYSFVPGLAVFAMAESAKVRTPLCLAARRVLSPFAAENDLNVLLSVYRDQRIFAVFSEFNFAQPPKILWLTGAGVMMLASLQITEAEAYECYRSENGEMSATERVIFGQELTAARRDGMLFRVQQLRQWTISLPFVFRENACVLTVFGNVPDKFDNRLLEVECRRLIARLLASTREFVPHAK